MNVVKASRDNLYWGESYTHNKCGEVFNRRKSLDEYQRIHTEDTN